MAEKTKEKNKKIYWGGMLLYYLFIGVVLYLGLTYNLKTFEYRTTMTSPTAVYNLVSGESVTQKLEEDLPETISGFTFCFGTYATNHTGTLTLDLLEDGEVVRTSVLDTAELIDNAHQDFYFDHPYTLDSSKDYTVSISFQSDLEGDSLAPYVVTEGSMEASLEGALDQSMVHETIGYRTRSQRIALVLLLSIFTFFFWLCIYQD